MKWIAENTKRTFVLVALLASLMFAFPTAAQVTNSGSTLRVMPPGETHTGFCCTVWSDSIAVQQPEKPLPIVVTWSTDYRATGPMEVGLRINNAPCTFYGPAYLAAATPANDTYASVTFQWVVMPGDYGVAKGTNTIRLCGGAMSGADSISLGFFTLTARVDK